MTGPGPKGRGPQGRQGRQGRLLLFSFLIMSNLLPKAHATVAVANILDIKYKNMADKMFNSIYDLYA